ncbi:MAG: tRNA-dihydrouridine synthase [Clostridia bacterium]|nr:tRNA-dihydrouridine synthase [Clostridia bacterium]
MQAKPLKIGNLTLKNNLLFAPLAGFSDFAMRSICLSFGAGLCFTEMVSAKGLIYNSEATKNLLYTSPDEKIKAAQIFGNEPEIMRKAIELPEMEKFDIIDINFGCPMPKIYNNGEGSALLLKPQLAEKIVSELKKSGKIITAKMRIGVKDGEFVTEDFIKALEQGGADMVTVHGRTRDKIYAGEPNYEEIRKAKLAVNIPVVANGGIFNKDDAEKMIAETGADGIMIARGALHRPEIFANLLGNNPDTDRKTLIKRHIALLKTKFDDKTVAVNFRKQLCYYLKGEVGSAKLKEKIFKTTNTKDLIAEIENFY